MHCAIFFDRLEIYNGKICRVVRARVKSGQELDVARFYEDGKVRIRNIVFHYGACRYYVYALPKEMVKMDDGSIKPYGLDSWEEPAFKVGSIVNKSNAITDAQLDMVLKVHPQFKWTLQKLPAWDLEHIFKALQFWLINPKVELLYASKFFNIAENRTFAKMGKIKRKSIVKALQSDRFTGTNPTLAEVCAYIQYAISHDQYIEYHDFQFRNKFRCTWPVYQWLIQQGHDRDFDYIVRYANYRKMAIAAGHDFSDPYWYKPKQIGRAHSKVMDEVRNIQAIKDQEIAKQKQQKFAKVASKLVKKVIQENGWSCYVPQTVQDIELQAQKLNQCLIYADYIGKMARKECTLLFIRFNGKPIATAELKNGAINQFYGNEKSRNIMPSPKARQILDYWMATYNTKQKKSA